MSREYSRTGSTGSRTRLNSLFPRLGRKCQVATDPVGKYAKSSFFRGLDQSAIEAALRAALIDRTRGS